MFLQVANICRLSQRLVSVAQDGMICQTQKPLNDYCISDSFCVFFTGRKLKFSSWNAGGGSEKLFSFVQQPSVLHPARF